MIPATGVFLEKDFKVEAQPGFTYRLEPDEKCARGYVDGLEAVRQAVYKILMTERYQYVMYSWNYGIELLDLFGEPLTYVCPELKRRITEALLMDDRIQEVDGFEFAFPGKDRVHVSFTVHTIFGEIQAEREVDF